LNGHPVLSNKVGGLSGTAIRPLALRAVEHVRAAIGNEPILIGMGGISTVDDVLQFKAAGADLFGVGSALTGMTSQQMSAYFDALDRGLKSEARDGVRRFLPRFGWTTFPLNW
jgi:dihydroorotate dehydrogenase (NAD+) catalytic subunit